MEGSMGSITETSDLDVRAAAAKHSSEEMESIIKDFKPFLRSRAAKYASQDVSRREELYSTAMIAFYEAIKQYDAQKGHFFPFANNVVRNHLIDHIRKIYRHEDKSISLEANEELKASAQTDAIEKISVRMFEHDRRRESIGDEIEQFKIELGAWGISLDSLAKQSPKHKKLSETYKIVISQILEAPDIVQTIQLKRYFPIKAISEISGLPQKKLERARTFILASIIIKMGDYDFLSEYVGERR